MEGDEKMSLSQHTHTHSLSLCLSLSVCLCLSLSVSVCLSLLDQNEEAKPGEKDAVRSRCDVIHTLALCEMSHFHQQRRADFKDMMRAYFDAQIKFHEDVSDCRGRHSHTCSAGGFALVIDQPTTPSPDTFALLGVAAHRFSPCYILPWDWLGFLCFVFRIGADCGQAEGSQGAV